MDRGTFEHVAALARLFREQGLRELAIEDGEFKLQLRRAARVGSSRPAQPRARRVSRQAAVSGRKQGRTVAVRAPLIGVFYRAASPDGPPFVEVGDIVSEGETVCIVEAMKVFNEIKAEWRGRVVAIPAENGALVQAGDPLIVLEFLSAATPGET